MGPSPRHTHLLLVVAGPIHKSIGTIVNRRGARGIASGGRGAIGVDERVGRACTADSGPRLRQRGAQQAAAVGCSSTLLLLLLLLHHALHSPPPWLCALLRR